MSESRARLLIVEDNVVLAENLDDIFSSRGYAVAHANSASAALAIARDEGFELALVDVNLPDSAGTDLLPALRDACPNAEMGVWPLYTSDAAHQKKDVGHGVIRVL